MIDMITLIKRAIVMIELVFAPTHMIMIGPRATLGRELSIVRKGSRTSLKNLFKYKIILIKNAISMPPVNEMMISFKVTPMWRKSSPEVVRVNKVLMILLGEENINELIMPVLAPISHKVTKHITKRD